MNLKNPFEFDAANNLSKEDVLDFYIDDYNYSRFLLTKRNIFLQGSRGTGKTMSLLYNSFPIQFEKKRRDDKEINFEKIGIYIPCNTPLYKKKEYLLLETEFAATLENEHFLVLNILFRISDTLSIIEKHNESLNTNSFLEKFEYVTGSEIKNVGKIFKSLKLFSNKELMLTQKYNNALSKGGTQPNLFSFTSLIIPLLEQLSELQEFKKSHFIFLIDDVHDLNSIQKKIINSWIAYRDHSTFSFKLATADQEPFLQTSNEGMILEGHDFIAINMIKPYQNKNSEFGKLARKIIDRRLTHYGIKVDSESFFPINPSFQEGIEHARQKVKQAAEEKYPENKGTQRSDYVAKYTRSEYFKSRSSKANTPPYSGLDIIIDVSTGVIRNLLDPCFWMYDYLLSDGKENITFIPHNTQRDILINRSNTLWNRVRNLYTIDYDCSKDQSAYLNNIFDNLMIYFKSRLESKLAEPRAINFIITEAKEPVKSEIDSWLKIALRAQLLYTRSGKDKKDGRLITVYILNRLLLITHGLDPHGQYANASIKAVDLYRAGKQNIKIPLPKTKSTNTNQTKLDL